jgi:hypothetical protein
VILHTGIYRIILPASSEFFLQRCRRLCLSFSAAAHDSRTPWAVARVVGLVRFDI